MTETVFPEMPEQDSDGVRTFCQVRGDIYRIVISPGRRRSSFQATLEDNQLVVDPKPILGIGGDTGDELVRDIRHAE